MVMGALSAVITVLLVVAAVVGNEPDPAAAKADSCGQALAPVSAIVDVLQGGAQGQLDPTGAADRLGPSAQQLRAVSEGSQDPRFQQLATDAAASIALFNQRVAANPQADFAQDGPEMARRVQAVVNYCQGGA